MAVRPDCKPFSFSSGAHMRRVAKALDLGPTPEKGYTQNPFAVSASYSLSRPINWIPSFLQVRRCL